MARDLEWTQETWERSVSSRCWWYTPYDAGWDGCRQHDADISADDELREIVHMEGDLDDVPEWAVAIVERDIRTLPPCGHCHFPRAYVDAAVAIGAERPTEFVHVCYTCDRQRKERALDYIFCLDAWLAGVGPEDAARELNMRERPGPDWDAVCRDLWQVLGERTELKELLVERIIHRYRWWVKTLTWDDDARDVFGGDMYLGDIRGSGDAYGDERFRDPYFVECQVPRVQRIEARIAELCLDGDFFRSYVESSWLCAPKAFRYLEKNLWGIGKEKRYPPEEEVPDFLQCADTHPDTTVTAEWWQSFLASLDAWARGERGAGTVAEGIDRVLGEDTAVKRWLVRLLAHRCRMLEKNTDDGLAKLVHPRDGRKQGARTIDGEYPSASVAMPLPGPE